MCNIVVCIDFVFTTLFVNCSVKDTPVINCRYNTKGGDRLGGLLKGDFQLVLAFRVVLAVITRTNTPFLTKVFIHCGAGLLSVAIRTFHSCSVSFLFVNFDVCTSSFFATLGSKFISTTVSFYHAVVFRAKTIVVLPFFLNISKV